MPQYTTDRREGGLANIEVQRPDEINVEREGIARWPGMPQVEKDGTIIAGRSRQGIDEQTLRRLDKLVTLDRRLRRQGIRPATILNMNPYMLHVNGVLHSDLDVAPCPKGRPYSMRVIRDYKYDWRDETDDNWSPVEFVPIVLADEFTEQYRAHGGVVVFEGDGERINPLEVPAIVEMMKEAEQAQIAFARIKVREANNEWNTPNRQGARNIDDIHRALAWLLHDKTGQELPEWIEKIPGQMGLGDPCPRCKTVPKSGAYACPSCGFIIDPVQAYEMGEITEDNPAMLRLSRAKLEELGVSELIEENLEERKARVKRDAEAKKHARRKNGEQTGPKSPETGTQGQA